MLNATQSSSSSSAVNAPPNRLRAQAEELEGVFLTTLVKEMFATVHSESGFNGGFGEETWRGMQAEQFAATLAQGGGIGLADALVSDLIAVQQSAPTSPLTLPQGAYR